MFYLAVLNLHPHLLDLNTSLYSMIANRIQTSIKFRIVNMTYEPDLGKKESSSYIKLAGDLKSKVTTLFCNMFAVPCVVVLLNRSDN